MRLMPTRSPLALQSLRAAVAVVPQDTVLFHASILENIRYATEGGGKRDCMVETHTPVVRIKC